MEKWSPVDFEGPAPTRRQRMASLAKRALIMELRGYDSLWRSIRGKPHVPEGGQGFRYHSPMLAILIVFIVLSAIEIPILDLITKRWLPVRIFVLALGIWGFTWMIGLLCAYFTRPHTVGLEGIRVREGLEVDILVPWRDFASIRFFPSTQEDEQPRVFIEAGQRVCAIGIRNETNLEVTFERPTRVRLPGLAPKGGTHELDVLRFWADEPKAMLRATSATLKELE